MTPKEKAFEMIKKYADFTNSWEHDERIIHYAILAVDEILNAIPNEYLDYWKGESQMVLNEDIEYWQKVKQEIKKYEY